MGDSIKNGGGTTATVVTFTVENLLYTAALTSTVLFLSHYFSIVHMPAIVFMFVGVVSVLMALHVITMLLIFSMRHKSAGGAFSDTILSEVSQGFSVISSLLWLGLLLCMFLDVPRITSIPNLPSSASVVSLAIVLGFSIVIPFLATVVTYAAVPAGGRNSLVFNGSTVGAVSLMFFVMVSFGSGGVMRCSPYDGAGASMYFFVSVCTYWGLLYVIELAVFLQFSPLSVLWNMLTGREQGINYMTPEDNINENTGFLSSFSITYWRIPGCILNILIVVSTTLFCPTSMYFSVIVAAITVGTAHIPLIFSIDLDWFLLHPQGQDIQVATVDNPNNVNMNQTTDKDRTPTGYTMYNTHPSRDSSGSTYPANAYPQRSEVFPTPVAYPHDVFGPTLPNTPNQYENFQMQAGPGTSRDSRTTLRQRP
jgi:hypothetical protein